MTRAALIVLVAVVGMGGCKRVRRNQYEWSGRYHAVSANGMHTCVLDENDLPHCWGERTNVRMVPVPLVPMARIASGRRYACGLGKADGTIQCWGWCQSTQCEVPEGTYTELALADDGGGCAWGAVTRCWGDATTVEVPPADVVQAGFTDIVFGAGWSIALMKDHSVRVWGREAVAEDSEVLGWTRESTKFSAIGGRGASVCVIDERGHARCVAKYENKVPPVLENVRAIDMANPLGAWPACSLLRTGEIRCTTNVKGESIGPLKGDNVDLAVGMHHVCGLDSRGVITCSGNDYAGQVSPRTAWP